MLREGHHRGGALTSPTQPTQHSPQRFLPRHGQLLSKANIRGNWWPSASVNACGVFAVVWSTPQGKYWAPLHDFHLVDQLSLIDDCRKLDKDAGYPGAWPEGRVI